MSLTNGSKILNLNTTAREIQILQLNCPEHHVGEKQFCSIDTWGRCYKTFYGRKLRIFVISQSVCSWRAFPAQSNVCGQGQEPTHARSTSKVFHSGRLAHKHQTIPVRHARVKHSSLLRKIVTYGRKKFNNIGP